MKTMLRENAALLCSCGRVLITWSGAYMWTTERIQEAKEE